MSTNRSNNRRRGRGNNRGPGGGNQSNRIDSRARGNAPQMLEKFKKLAHDASLNDDRVQTEYYLQFADHYFRVLAANKAQRDDQRPRRDNERDDGDDDNQDEDGGYDERGRDQRPHTGGGRDDRDQARQGRGRPQAENSDDDDDDNEDRPRGGAARDGDGQDNPFIREARVKAPRGRPRAKPQQDRAGQETAERDGLDPGSLPPPIARGTEGNEGTQDEGDDSASPPAKPARAAKPRAQRAPRTRQPRLDDDGDAGNLEAVS